MSRVKKFLRAPLMTLILALLAVSLLLAGSIGGTRAALEVFSEDYQSRVQLSGIDVSLLENGKQVADGGKLMSSLRGSDPQLLLGKKYDWPLAVRNSGAIDQYVRVTIRRYWVDTDGKTKLTTLDPSLINLGLVTSGTWKEDTSARTPERTVLFYQSILPHGGDSAVFCKSLTINGDLTTAVSETTSGNTTIYTYAYDGISFVVEVDVDAVQTHNANSAITSAWGYIPG